MNDKLFQKILSDLKKLKNAKNVEGMKRFGINPKFALGISVTGLRKMGKHIGTNHEIAIKLWQTEIHEARILATIIDDYTLVTEQQMEKWVKDFNSWDLCDQCCNNLFRKTPFAVEKSFEWCESESEFIKRAGFVLIAVLAVHNNEMKNQEFKNYFPLIIQHSLDERNYVKKAVNWSLRQIGKRNLKLHKEAISICNRLIASQNQNAKWIGKDALRELVNPQIISRLKN